MESQTRLFDDPPPALDQVLSDAVPKVGPWDAGKREGLRLDFKETPETTRTPDLRRAEARRHLLEDIVETAVSFANSEGGLLVVGVRNRSAIGEAVVVGVDLEQWSPGEVRDKVFESTTPHLSVVVQPVPLHGTTVLVV